MAARQDADRLLGIVNDLLDLTRIEQGRVVLDLHPLAPDELVTDAVERFAARAGGAGLVLGARAPTGLPRVGADIKRGDHIYKNIICNALARRPRGGTIEVAAEAAEDGFVRFRVTGSGEGIPPEHLASIFEKFYRVPGSETKGGAGLGLAIAREIVAAHGGQIAAESVPGEGTTCTFTLPAALD